LKAQNKEAPSRIDRAEAKYKEAAAKIKKLEGQIKDAAAPLFCKLENLVAAVKDKIWACFRIEDLEIQGERDRKKIEDINKARFRLRNEKGLLTRQLEDKKKKHAWKAMALSQLEEANLTVKKLAKFDAPGRIRTDAIKKFFKTL
jgi:hypothetical protein